MVFSSLIVFFYELFIDGFPFCDPQSSGQIPKSLEHTDTYSYKMEDTEPNDATSVLSLQVTEEQREAIYHFFCL